MARSVRSDSSNHNSTKSGKPALAVGKIVEAGVDWITATCKSSDNMSQFREIGVALLHVQSDRSQQVQPWRFEQFEGLKADGVAMGEGEGMAIIRLSGPCAYAHWRRVFELSTTCSRLDLQVTVSGIPDMPAKILRHHREALVHVSDRKRPPTIDIRISNRTGNTLYFNTRQSSRFGRVYDKFVESKLDHYVGCGRYETQLNGRAAGFAGRYLSQVGSVNARVESHVHAFFAARGLVLPWNLEATSLLSSPRQRSNASRRLAWLSAQVRGCLHTLIEEGYGEQALSALGLPTETLKMLDHHD